MGHPQRSGLPGGPRPLLFQRHGNLLLRQRRAALPHRQRYSGSASGRYLALRLQLDEQLRHPSGGPGTRRSPHSGRRPAPALHPPGRRRLSLSPRRLQRSGALSGRQLEAHNAQRAAGILQQPGPPDPHRRPQRQRPDPRLRTQRHRPGCRPVGADHPAEDNHRPQRARHDAELRPDRLRLPSDRPGGPSIQPGPRRRGQSDFHHRPPGQGDPLRVRRQPPAHPLRLSQRQRHDTGLR